MKTRGIALGVVTAALLLVGATPSAAGTGIDPCVSAAAEAQSEYRDAYGLDEDDPTYVVCVNGGLPTVFGVNEAGQLPPAGPAIDAARDDAGRDDSVPGTEASYARAAADCDIESELEVRCYWHVSYYKVDGPTGAIEWERGVEISSRNPMQFLTFNTEIRATHDQGWDCCTSR